MLSKVVRRTIVALSRRGVGKGTLGFESRSFKTERKSATNCALWQRSLLQSIISSATYAAKATLVKKEFAIHHPIAVYQYDQYYVLDPAEENNKRLIPTIRRGEYAMLHGANGSGKTTRIYRAAEQLKDEYTCLMIDFQRIDMSNFWKSFGNALQQTNNNVDLPKIQSSDDFLNLFISEDSFKNKKAVLFLDEFDKITEATRDDRGQFLSLLRLLQQRPNTSLQSVVAVGTYSIVNIGIDALGSALNISEKIVMRHWTKDEITILMQQISPKIMDEVASYTHKITDGYAGWVNLCGKAIRENPSLGTDLNEWHKYVENKLIKEMKNYPPVEQMIKNLSYIDADMATGVPRMNILRAKLAREYLEGILPSEFDFQNFQVLGIKPAILEFLIAEGAIIITEKKASTMLDECPNVNVVHVYQNNFLKTARNDVSRIW